MQASMEAQEAMKGGDNMGPKVRICCRPGVAVRTPHIFCRFAVDMHWSETHAAGSISSGLG